jgi:hypothetical protein
MKKRRKLTSTDTDTLEICSNQTRVLVLGVVHLDSPYQSLHLEAEKKKTCTQSNVGDRHDISAVCANARKGARAATSRTTINDHALVSDMMDEKDV